MFKVIENHIVIPKTDIESYDIHVDQCNTHEKISAWVYKLCSYSWVKTSTIQEFIDTATEHHALTLPKM
jgi:hypothetical protein